MPGFGAARQRQREEVQGGESSLSTLSLPHDVRGGAAGTAGLGESGLVGDGEFAGSRLREDGLGSFDVWKRDLKTDATDKVRDLPVEADEVFVFEKTEDASGFDDCASDYGFGEIAITANGDKLSELE